MTSRLPPKEMLENWHYDALRNLAISLFRVQISAS